MVPSAYSWDCNIPASARKLQEFTSHCCLQSWRMKLEVNLSALQKYRCKFNGSQWQRFYSWWKEMTHYTSKKNCSLSDLLPTKRLSAQNYMFGGFYGPPWQSGVMVSLTDRFNLGTWHYCKVFQTNAAWGWIPFHFYLFILSRGYTVSCPAHLRNQSCLVVSSKKPKRIFSWHPKEFSSIKLGKWYSPGCCITKTPRTHTP